MKCYYCFILLCCSHFANAQLTARLDSFFRRQPASQPGFALSIEKNGQIIYRNVKGAADPPSGNTPLDTLSNFRMASVSKQFTAMGILLLEKKGTLSVDDPIGRWLPEIPAHTGRIVTIRHLLTHTSGLYDYEALIPDTQRTQLLDADVLRMVSAKDSTYFTPGTKFSYSNSGFCLLALIIERASGQTFPDFIRQNIFAPLHMDNSAIYELGKQIPHRAMGYAKDSAGNMIPSDQSITSATKGDGGVYTSLIDYRKWMQALQQHTLIRLAPTLKRLRLPIAGRPSSYYAAGWFELDEQPLILFHSGSTCGFSNFVVQIPGDTWSIVYFSNLADNKTPFRQILEIIKEEKIADLSGVFALHDLTQ